MDFLIDRHEIVALAHLGRTTTFDLQSSEDLIIKSTAFNRNWYCLRQVLCCYARLFGIDPPTDADFGEWRKIIFEARLAKTDGRSKREKR